MDHNNNWRFLHGLITASLPFNNFVTLLWTLPFIPYILLGLILVSQFLSIHMKCSFHEGKFHYQFMRMAFA